MINVSKTISDTFAFYSYNRAPVTTNGEVSVYEAYHYLHENSVSWWRSG